MLGYDKSDYNDMLYAVQSALTTVNPDDDPFLYNNLFKTIDFFMGLESEGHFN
jgi:hypothetical protein